MPNVYVILESWQKQKRISHGKANDRILMNVNIIFPLGTSSS